MWLREATNDFRGTAAIQILCALSNILAVVTAIINAGQTEYVMDTFVLRSITAFIFKHSQIINKPNCNKKQLASFPLRILYVLCLSII